MTITVSGITKRFADHTALDGVDLSIAEGELVALLGPSGSGKTTLLRILAGLDLPDAGRVLFDQTDALALPAKDRGVGFVFQHYALFRHMTVAENIAFGLTVRPRAERASKAAIAARVAELLDAVQLSGLAARYPGQLSGGQRQRVALARALAINPKVLLLDEPFGALDAKVRKELRRWLRRFHHELRVTTVFVTHDQEEAMELADRIVIVNNGRIEQDNTPEQIHAHPASQFVVEFLGDAARLSVEVVDGAVYLRGMALPIGTVGDLSGAADLFLRSYDVEVTGVAELGAVSALVLGLHTIGSNVRLTLSVADQEIEVTSAAPTVAALRLAVGQPVGLRITGAILFGQGRPSDPVRLTPRGARAAVDPSADLAAEPVLVAW